MRLPWVNRQRHLALARSFAEVRADNYRLGTRVDMLAALCRQHGIDPNELPHGWYTTSGTQLVIDGHIEEPQHTR